MSRCLYEVCSNSGDGIVRSRPLGGVRKTLGTPGALLLDQLPGPPGGDELKLRIISPLPVYLLTLFSREPSGNCGSQIEKIFVGIQYTNCNILFVVGKGLKGKIHPF